MDTTVPLQRVGDGTIKSKTSNIIAGLYGNALEWYDFLLYASFAPLFARLYFPTDNKLISLISTFGVFAVSFFMRPIGWAFFCHYGDKVGRRKSLILAITLMTITSLLISLTPAYIHIGIAATIIFTCLRLMQGFIIGGELPSSATFVIESSLSERRGFAGSLILSTAFLGIFVGSLVATLVTNLVSKGEMAWSWRLAYVFGAILGLIGMYLRVKSKESPHFISEEKPEHIPLKLIFFQYKIPLFFAVLYTSIMAIGNYVLIAFVNVFLTHYQGFLLRDALKINLVALLFLTLLIPLMGILSDYVGYKRLFTIGLCMLLILIFPIFWLLVQHDFTYAMYGELLLSVSLAPINATVAILISEMFPANIRASGISMGYNTGQAGLGGTVPLIAIALIDLTGSSFAPAWYVFIFGFIVLLMVIMKKN